MPYRHRLQRETEIGATQIRPYPQTHEDASE